MPDAAPPPTLSQTEAITALVHYYRAEAQRSLAWRERLDRTTNWAVGTTAAFLGFGFAHPEISHAFFLFGLAMAYLLLFVESRRFRFFDAYEYRVRLLHQHFIYGVLVGKLDLDDEVYWRAELASDLRYPQYKMTLKHAVGRRLRSNYIYLFAVLLAGWLLKISLHPVAADSWRQILDQAAVGHLPGWLPLTFMVLFVLHLVLLARLGKKPEGGRDIMHAPH